MAARNATVDKRRIILDAAVRVFARQGFHTCRVSDIADEAGVAYGLVYHYFGSKDEVLDTLFLERWGVMVEAIAEIDRRELLAHGHLFGIDLADQVEHHVPALQEERVEHLVLGAEVVVDEAVGDARLVRDVCHPAGVEPLAREHAHRRVEDQPALLGGGLGACLGGPPAGPPRLASGGAHGPPSAWAGSGQR